VRREIGSWFFLHDPVAAPEDGVAVEILRGVEPEAVALLPAGRRAAVAVHVGLHPPLPAPHVPQELEVQLVVRPLVHVPVRHLHRRGRHTASVGFLTHRRAEGGSVCYGWTDAHVEGDDDAGGVVGGELDAGAEEPVEVRALRREPGACATENRATAMSSRAEIRTRASIDRARTAASAETCSLVEGDVHPLAVAVEREVGVAEQLRVALPEEEGRSRRG
jgi:hypothetical protein